MELVLSLELCPLELYKTSYKDIILYTLNSIIKLYIYI